MLQQQYYAPLNKHKHSLLTIFALDFTISTLVSNAVFNFLSSPYTSYRIHLLKHPKTPPISIFKYFSQINLRSFIVNTEFIPSLGLYYAVKELIRVGRDRGGRGEGKNIEERKIDVMWAVNNFMNGGLAGFITTLITYPIQIPLPVILSRSLQWNTPSTPRLTRLKKPLYLLRKSKDILYRGFFLSSISITLSRSILYGFFDTFKIFFERDFVSQTVLGGYGAFFGTLVSYPFVTVIRNRIVKKEKVRSNYESWRMIVEEEGWRGLYRGVRRQGVKAVFAGVVLAGIEWGQFVVYPRFSIE